MPPLKLLLLRHAEAEEAHGRPDPARPLTRRGAQAAARLGQALSDEGYRPNLVLASDAVRAKATADAVAKALGLGVELTVDPRLYLAGLAELSAVVGEAPAAARDLLVVGHNPGWSLATRALSDAVVDLDTCQGAALQVEAPDWAAGLKLSGAWELVRVVGR